MAYVVICITALFASAITLFSGFGLGTVLLPVFAIFFPIELAIAMTAIVHLLNNVFKFWLVGKHANWGIVMKFGIPAIIAAFLGAGVLTLLADLKPIATYPAFGREFKIELVKLIVAILMIAFALIELSKRFERWSIPPRYLPLGGLLSGFFGGLTGHQGALRSAFLIKAGLSKEAFIATGVVIAVMIDVARLGVYTSRFAAEGIGDQFGLIAAATIAAFAGAFLGARLLPILTLRHIQVLVTVLLIVIAIALAAGLI